jgi:L-lactate dehydrogenase complex protein LldE
MPEETRIALFPTCVLEALAPDVGAAAIRVLRTRGHEVHIPDDATCCGQPAWNAGFTDEAAQVARTSLDALAADNSDAIVVPAGSCATMMRVYWPELFRITGDAEARDMAEDLLPRIYEFTEFLAAAPGHDEQPSEGREIAYHHSCHMLRELDIEAQPVDLLETAGNDVVAWDGAQRCCGFGGLFSVKQPEISVAMADEKLDSLAETTATCLVGADLSCLFQLEGRMRALEIDLPVRHVAEMLDRESTGG